MARSWSAAAAALFLPVAIAQAVIVGGGGSSRTDCLVVFDADVNYPEDKPTRFRCADGDPCDADGTVNGQCAFQLTICANDTTDPTRCTLNGVDSIAVEHALDNGDRKFDPDFQALQNRINNGIVGPNDPPNTDPNACALPSTLLVPVSGAVPENVQAGQEAGEAHVVRRARPRRRRARPRQDQDG